ncbi:hypothetical protein L7F22_027536 [Adiantum nelumboides]|nr:hypothetical protein [Adiantum nelumboides]
MIESRKHSCGHVLHERVFGFLKGTHSVFFEVWTQLKGITMQALSRKSCRTLQLGYACSLDPCKPSSPEVYEAKLIKGFWRRLSVYSLCETEICSTNPCLCEDNDGSRCEPIAEFASRTTTKWKQDHTKSWDMVSTEEVLTFICYMQEPPSIEDFIYLLQKCRKERVLGNVLRVHTHLCSNGLETNGVLGNILVQLFLECKYLGDSNRVFVKMSYPNEHTWTALIQGYNEYRDYENALHLFNLMHLDADPSKYAYVAGLKACAGKKYPRLAQQIHAEAVKDDLDMDPFVINSLVGAYSRCGLLPEARKMFQSLRIPSVVSWTALMTGCAEHGVGEEDGHDRNSFVGNSLVDMYAKSHACLEAINVFTHLPSRSVIAWTALMTVYLDQGLVREALVGWDKMQVEGISPDEVAYVLGLQACGIVRALDRGRVLHSQIVKHGLECVLVVCNTLIHMYDKCLSLLDAYHLFVQHPSPTSASWSALIAGYAENDLCGEVLMLLEQMEREGLCPNAAALASSLKACGTIGSANKGQELHAEIVKKGLTIEAWLESGEEAERSASVALSRKSCRTLQLGYACSLDPCKPSSPEVYEAKLIKGFWRRLSVYSLCETEICSTNPCLCEDNDGSRCEPIAEFASRTPTKWKQDHTKSWDMVSTEEVLTFICYMQEPPSIEDFIYLLQKCRKERVLGNVLRVHTHLCSNGLETNGVLGNILVQLFLECKYLGDSNRVFVKMSYPNEHTWTALIQGYNEYRDYENALHLFNLMHLDADPSKYAYVAGLKACAGKKYPALAQQIHAEAVKDDLDMDPFVINSLVGAYSRCGLLPEARKMFQSLRIPSVVSWTALMTGCAEHGAGEEVLHCLDQMLLEGICPNAFTVACGLRTCTTVGALEKGQHIHSVITVIDEFKGDLYVGNALVDLYAKCGKLDAALKAFNKLKARDVVTWTTLVTGFVDYGLGNSLVDMYAKSHTCLEAINVFTHLPSRSVIAWTALMTVYLDQGLVREALVGWDKMQVEGISPDEVAYVLGLQACGIVRALDRGRVLHSQIVKHGLECVLVVCNTLIHMYDKCLSLLDAYHLFVQHPSPTSASWSALIAGYAENDLCGEVLMLLEQMEREGLCPNAAALASSLKACGTIGSANKGQELHAEIVKKGLTIEAWLESGEEAERVFVKMSYPNEHTWTALIQGYNEYRDYENALHLFNLMHLDADPSKYAYVAGLKACAGKKYPRLAQQIHAEAVKDDLDMDPFVINSLVGAYSRCGLLPEARKMFQSLRIPSVVSWTALMTGCAEHGGGEEVLHCLDQMLLEGNSLVDMYAKSHACLEAINVFTHLPSRSVIAWTALMTVYLDQGLVREALVGWDKMQVEGISPDEVAYVLGLQACGIVRALDRGRVLHSQIVKHGLECVLVVCNTLIHMYDKCLSLLDAYHLFVQHPSPTSASWSALIAGYAENDLCGEVLMLLEQMEREGLCPNAAALASSLKACGTIGSANKGQELHAEIVKKGLTIEAWLESGEEAERSGPATSDTWVQQLCGPQLQQKEAVDRYPTQREVMRGRAIGLSALLEELATSDTQVKNVDVRQVVNEIVSMRALMQLRPKYAKLLFIIYDLMQADYTYNESIDAITNMGPPLLSQTGEYPDFLERTPDDEDEDDEDYLRTDKEECEETSCR